MWTDPLIDPTLEQDTINDAKEEILHDLRNGLFTADDICSFSDLHEFVDANEYGSLTELVGNMFRSDQALFEFCNNVQDALNAWIIEGGLR
jgi:hypothetical protein